jgi:NAD-reducing hydrogenase small subunit
LPRLLPQVKPLHAYVAVDYFLPGCPPPADAIGYLITALLAGEVPAMAGRSRFGA